MFKVRREGTSMEYILKPGQPHQLPQYADDNPLRLAIPRPATPLAGTLPAKSRREYALLGMTGEVITELEYGSYDCCVMPQVGFHSPVDIGSFSTDQHPSRHLPYRRGDEVVVTPDRPIASVLAPLWDRQAPHTVKVFEIWRQLPALVYGRVPDDVSDAKWLITDTGKWRLLPGSYILCELNGYGGRVVPPNFLVREFRAINELTGAVVEEFDAPTG